MHGMVDFGQCPSLPTPVTAPLVAPKAALLDHCLAESWIVLPELHHPRQPELKQLKTRLGVEVDLAPWQFYEPWATPLARSHEA